MRTLSESLVREIPPKCSIHNNTLSTIYLLYPFFFSSDSVRLECRAEDKADVKLNKTKVGSRVRIFAAVCTRFLCFYILQSGKFNKEDIL